MSWVGLVLFGDGLPMAGGGRGALWRSRREVACMGVGTGWQACSGGGVRSMEQVGKGAAGNVQTSVQRESLCRWQGCSVSHSESPLLAATNQVATISGDNTSCCWDR